MAAPPLRVVVLLYTTASATGLIGPSVMSARAVPTERDTPINASKPYKYRFTSSSNRKLEREATRGPSPEHRQPCSTGGAAESTAQVRHAG
jgi:hypothetical protein